jgi:hypothetical protein
MGVGPYDGNDTYVLGDDGSADGVKITSTADGSKKRLDVAASITSITASPSAYSSKLRYLDMNASNGGVARETVITNATWVDIFSYSGSGLVIGFGANLETGADWQIRLLIDGEEIFNDATNGILLNDISSDSAYDWDSSGKSTVELADNIGLYLGSHDRLVWSSPLKSPTRYTASVVVKVKRVAAAGTKKFKAGLMVLTKDS